MRFGLHRLDAVYTVPFAPPLIDLVGEVPAFFRHIYSAFMTRYPVLTADAFRGLAANTFAEVGMQVVWLEGRLQLDIRADQMLGRATNLQRPEEARFAQDCVVLAHDAVAKFIPATKTGRGSIRLSTWLTVDGGRAWVDATLKKVAAPRNGFDGRRVGAEKLSYNPRLVLENERQGWRIAVVAEPSAVPNADLFLLRDYTLAPGLSAEDQFRFVESTTLPILEWLGLEPMQQ